MLYTDADIEEALRKLGEMLAGKSKDTVQNLLIQLVKEIAYNEVSGKCKYSIEVVKK